LTIVEPSQEPVPTSRTNMLCYIVEIVSNVKAWICSAGRENTHAVEMDWVDNGGGVFDDDADGGVGAEVVHVPFGAVGVGVVA
jgi:hypothetical protein